MTRVRSFVDVDVSLVDETQERQDDDLIFDYEVLEVDVMHVEAKIDGKDDQSKKLDDNIAGLDDNTAGEAVTTAGDDSVVPITNKEITLARTLIQIKAAKPKVITTTATTTTTSRPKDKRVVVQEPRIDREDLEALWRILKAKYGDTRPENEFDRVLYGDLKVMFEPDIKSDIWRMLQGYRVTIWKLIDSSGVHFV
ncbi:hypothetical protein Tco_1199311, partial [Tanacetum coccineum]